MGTLDRPSSGRVAIAGADVDGARRPRAGRAARAPDRLRLPAVLPDGRDDRGGERRAGHALRRGAGRRGATAARPRGAGARRARPPPRPPPRPALGRRAPAGGDRARGRRPPGDRLRRRADRQPRLARRRRDPRPAARAARRGHDGRGHHPRRGASPRAAAPGARCATAASRRTDERRPAPSLAPAPRRPAARRRRRPAHAPPARRALGARHRHRHRLDGRGARAVGLVARRGCWTSSTRLGTNLLTVAPGQTLGGDDATLPRAARRSLSRLGGVEQVATRARRSTRPCGAPTGSTPTRPAGSR